jgi:hypothetical protein
MLASCTASSSKPMPKLSVSYTGKGEYYHGESQELPFIRSGKGPKDWAWPVKSPGQISTPAATIATRLAK